MNENEQNINRMSTDGRVRGTRKYISLYLHPWNDDRIAYYRHSLITATLIFEYDKQPFERMINILNERLDYPLTTEEQEDCWQKLIRDLERGLL
ncbi:hypothetical protein WVIC16_60095 [Weissella viridescens]|nr:hypothetical protein WVIC16_60095 [Weissella viridescens]